jgi:hypothetical protein
MNGNFSVFAIDYNAAKVKRRYHSGFNIRGKNDQEKIQTYMH